MAAMRFIKMEGLGNDYVYVDCFEERIERPAEWARRVSDRHFGVGGDGLILIKPPSTREADCRMEMYNADGSRAQMCGNGIRCVAKYVYDHGIARKEVIRVETDAGPKSLRVETGSDGKAARIEVNMGPPILARGKVPFVDGGDPREPARNVPVEVMGREFQLTAVSMGNPHAVIRVDGRADLPALADLPLEDWGPHFERHVYFPERTNTEFIAVRGPRELDFRVWERGSGETLACGTGACAALVAGVLNGWCDHEAVVHLRGGDLQIRWEEGGPVYMTGPAVEVFSGEI
jgi:diaminopimelate epimerase